VTTLPGAVKLLAALPCRELDGRDVRDTGRSPRGVFTHGGLRSPSSLITADDVERGKPDPQPYSRRREAARPSILRGALVIEDAPAGIEAGKAPG
jgi:sugar-phosphatase